jgi:hypothetical protein
MCSEKLTVVTHVTAVPSGFCQRLAASLLCHGSPHCGGESQVTVPQHLLKAVIALAGWLAGNIML